MVRSLPGTQRQPLADLQRQVLVVGGQRAGAADAQVDRTIVFGQQRHPAAGLSAVTGTITVISGSARIVAISVMAWCVGPVLVVRHAGVARRPA